MAKKDIETEQDLYNMKLHEVKNVNSSLYVTRVIGGWLYEVYYDGSDGEQQSTSVTFVPEPSNSIIH